jgi:hypothetical protein
LNRRNSAKTFKNQLLWVLKNQEVLKEVEVRFYLGLLHLDVMHWVTSEQVLEELLLELHEYSEEDSKYLISYQIIKGAILAPFFIFRNLYRKSTKNGKIQRPTCY